MTDVSNTLAERGARYGKFIDHSIISQGLQDVMRESHNWGSLDADIKQALTTIADKIARILNGDPHYLDNYHDIQGYAKLVEDRLKAAQALFDAEPSDDIAEETAASDSDYIQSMKGISIETDHRNYYNKSDDPSTDIGNYRG